MIVGLTGGIGSGKSTVACLLVALGYPVYNSDDRARYLQENDSTLIAQTVELLGADVLENGRINRAKVAALVFTNSSLLQQLNAIVHPRVAKDFATWRSQQNAQILFKESAILVETGIYKQCEALVVVTAPEALRIARVVERDGVTEEQVRQRISKQMAESEKVKLADFVIGNNDRHLIIPQVLKMIEALKST
jgi:dephospho-CoA kinase